MTLTWSPDGKRILWAGGDGGSDPESMLRDGSQRHAIVDSGDVSQPDWQPPSPGGPSTVADALTGPVMR